MLFNLHEKKQSLLEVQFRDVADQKTSGNLTITENWTTGTQNLVEKERLMGSNLFTLKKTFKTKLYLLELYIKLVLLLQ